MKKPEQAFYHQLKNNHALPGDVCRVENTVDVGMPDISAAFGGRDYWVELKVSNLPDIETDIPNLLRPAQRVWHTRRGKMGTLTFVLTKCKDGISVNFFSRGHYLFAGLAEKKGNSFDYAAVSDMIAHEIKVL